MSVARNSYMTIVPNYYTGMTGGDYYSDSYNLTSSYSIHSLGVASVPLKVKSFAEKMQDEVDEWLNIFK